MDHLTRHAPSHWLGACHLAAGGGSRKYYWLEEQRPCGLLGTKYRFCGPQCSGIEVPVYPYLAEMSSKVSFVQSLQTTSYLPLFLLVQKKISAPSISYRAHGPNLVPTHEDPSLMTGKWDGGQDGWPYHRRGVLSSSVTIGIQGEESHHLQPLIQQHRLKKSMTFLHPTTPRLHPWHHH